MNNETPDKNSPLVAFGRALERTDRRVTTLDELMTQLATDVATLVARAGPDKGGPPTSWLLCNDPELAAEHLGDLIEWLPRVYLRYHGTFLPSCWLWHASVVEELWWLRQAHREAYAYGNRAVTKAGDWHDRALPGVTRRVRAAVGDCELSRHVVGGDRTAVTPAVPLHVAAEHLADEWAGERSTPPPTFGELREAAGHDTTRHRRAGR